MIEPGSDLSELLSVLDHAVMGDKYLAWYGQCRADGQSHRTAIVDTIRKFRLADQAWFGHRVQQGSIPIWVLAATEALAR